MQSSDDRESIEREFRASRLMTAARLEEAYSMLSADPACQAAIDGYKQFATLRDYHPRAVDHLEVALNCLEATGERVGASTAFWRILQEIAVIDALYDRAVRYKKRAEKT